MLGLQLLDLQLTSLRCNLSFPNHRTWRKCFQVMNGIHSSQRAHKQDGKDTKKRIKSSSFWKRAAEIVVITEPLVKVLWLVDGEKLAMGYIYEAMDQAKEHIKATYKDRVAKYGPIWEIIDRRWNNQLHRPIHAAGYFLTQGISIERILIQIRLGR